MKRQTSLEAYNEIKSNGLLSERRWQVYDLLYKYGPMTGSEMAISFKNKYKAIAPNAGNMVTRLSELRDMGCVKEIGIRVCPITGMKVIDWDVNDKIPVALKRPKRTKCQHCDGKGYL